MNRKPNPALNYTEVCPKMQYKSFRKGFITVSKQCLMNNVEPARGGCDPISYYTPYNNRHNTCGTITVIKMRSNYRTKAGFTTSTSMFTSFAPLSFALHWIESLIYFL